MSNKFPEDTHVLVRLFCPDCRGKFEVEESDIVEGEVLECTLCGAEIVILREMPLKIKLYNEDDGYY